MRFALSRRRLKKNNPFIGDESVLISLLELRQFLTNYFSALPRGVRETLRAIRSASEHDRLFVINASHRFNRIKRSKDHLEFSKHRLELLLEALFECDKHLERNGKLNCSVETAIAFINRDLKLSCNKQGAYYSIQIGDYPSEDTIKHTTHSLNTLFTGEHFRQGQSGVLFYPSLTLGLTGVFLDTNWANPKIDKWPKKVNIRIAEPKAVEFLDNLGLKPHEIFTEQMDHSHYYRIGDLLSIRDEAESLAKRLKQLFGDGSIELQTINEDGENKFALHFHPEAIENGFSQYELPYSELLINVHADKR